MPTSRAPLPQLEPAFASDHDAWALLSGVIKTLMAVNPAENTADAVVERARLDALSSEVSPDIKASFQVVVSVLCDLRLHGWNFRVKQEGVVLQRPTAELAPDLERERVRRMHAVNRNVQLMKESVRTFVRGLEKKRLGPQGWVSIFSLMRDGRELSEKLRKVSRRKHLADQLTILRSVVHPYLQIVGDGDVCEHTGLPLGDVWRYFRHTWASEYQTVPGRNLMLLVRDAAAAFHPVIGIAALASPVVHLRLRDEWIGWAPKQFVAELRERPTATWAKWLQRKLTQLVDGIFLDDLVRDHVVARRDITAPSEDVIARLEEEAAIAREKHRRNPTRAIHKNPTKDAGEEEWRSRAKTHLFRWKRCATLAEMLRARLRLQNAGFERPTKEALGRVLATSEGRQAVEVIRKHIKAVHIGNDVLDISVCGAIAPYSELAGGKLVAMMLTSPELIQMYTQRYGRSASIIASSMAARRITRRPRLTTLTTTSLYGAEPNQYTRIRIPATELGGESGNEICFRKLGLTRGQGSFHFSAVTIDLMEILLGQLADSRRVNSIFGEGVSPRLRKIRQGLDECGFPSDEVLTHGSPRIVYGIALAANQRDYLLERAKQPEYLLPQHAPQQVTAQIGDYWCCRWLVRRALRSDVVDRVESHNLVSPIQHGARVPLPRILEEEPLFFHQDL